MKQFSTIANITKLIRIKILDQVFKLFLFFIFSDQTDP